VAATVSSKSGTKDELTGYRRVYVCRGVDMDNSHLQKMSPEQVVGRETPHCGFAVRHPDVSVNIDKQTPEGLEMHIVTPDTTPHGAYRPIVSIKPWDLFEKIPVDHSTTVYTANEWLNSQLAPKKLCPWDVLANIPDNIGSVADAGAWVNTELGRSRLACCTPPPSCWVPIHDLYDVSALSGLWEMAQEPEPFIYHPSRGFVPQIVESVDDLLMFDGDDFVFVCPACFDKLDHCLCML
jgi:hypothetical protein